VSGNGDPEYVYIAKDVDIAKCVYIAKAWQKFSEKVVLDRAKSQKG
jgi:hypothetical protein